MNKYIWILFVIIFTVLLSFSYLFYRDIVIGSKDFKPQGCIPYDVNYDEIDGESFTLSWKTTNECIGYVKYGTGVDKIELQIKEIQGSDKRTDHLVKIEDLKFGTEYYFVIFSDGISYGFDNLPLSIKTRSY